jgi:transposase
MERITSGHVVSRDQVDAAVYPSGEKFMVDRNAAGLQQLCTRLQAIGSEIVVLETTGGFETIVAAALTSAELAVAVVKSRAGARLRQGTGRARQNPSDRCPRDRTFQSGHRRGRGRCRASRRACSPIWCSAAGRSWT